MASTKGEAYGYPVLGAVFGEPTASVQLGRPPGSSRSGIVSSDLAVAAQGRRARRRHIAPDEMVPDLRW